MNKHFSISLVSTFIINCTLFFNMNEYTMKPRSNKPPKTAVKVHWKPRLYWLTSPVLQTHIHHRASTLSLPISRIGVLVYPKFCNCATPLKTRLAGTPQICMYSWYVILRDVCLVNLFELPNYVFLAPIQILLHCFMRNFCVSVYCRNMVVNGIEITFTEVTLSTRFNTRFKFYKYI